MYDIVYKNRSEIDIGTDNHDKKVQFTLKLTMRVANDRKVNPLLIQGQLDDFMERFTGMGFEDYEADELLHSIIWEKTCKRLAAKGYYYFPGKKKIKVSLETQIAYHKKVTTPFNTIKFEE